MKYRVSLAAALGLRAARRPAVRRRWTSPQIEAHRRCEIAELVGRIRSRHRLTVGDPADWT